MEALDQIKARAEAAVPGASLEIIANGSPANQPSLLIDREHAVPVVQFLRDDPALRLDFCSNVTGCRLARSTVKKTVKVKTIVDGIEKEIDQSEEQKIPGYLEAVYHLFSIALKHGPVVVRMRTADRVNAVHLPHSRRSIGARNFRSGKSTIFMGIRFDGHPDLRRILMWDEFADHPMRRDYVQPDDFEYEPTPHDEVLERAKEHYAARPIADGAEPLTTTA
jgi:NADH-quinone oxidoreductase subunit C